MASLNRLSGYNRIVVKIGSALLVDKSEGLKTGWLESICSDIANIKKTGTEMLIVSSGAIALGKKLLGLTGRSLRLEENQAAAAAGQIELARAYSESFGKHGFSAGQVLLTLGDTEERRRYLNARATISTLLKLDAVPVINENDTVATSEIRYGDNDRLAARVATMVEADLLVLLSDVDGLYSEPPNGQNSPRFIENVPAITRSIEAMAGDAGTELSRGGMVTKIEAAKIATQGGTKMVICSGKNLHPLQTVASGGKSTWFDAASTPQKARKKWIAGQMDITGFIKVDQGAEKAMASGKSLLPAGMTSVSGNFRRGDIVDIQDQSGKLLGKGLVAYDHDEASKIVGCKSQAIAEILGYSGRVAVIHRDDMSLLPSVIEMEENHA